MSMSTPTLTYSYIETVFLQMVNSPINQNPKSANDLWRDDVLPEILASFANPQELKNFLDEKFPKSYIYDIDEQLLELECYLSEVLEDEEFIMHNTKTVYYDYGSDYWAEDETSEEYDKFNHARHFLAEYNQIAIEAPINELELELCL